MPISHIPKISHAVNAIGNEDIADKHKTAFICSRRFPAEAVLRIYDWAREIRESEGCVISGFHSLMERDVLNILLKGSQPLILAAARGLPKRYSPIMRRALEEGRLLVVSPFPDSVVRVTSDTARRRNRFMLEVADCIVIGHTDPDSPLSMEVEKIGYYKDVIRL